MSGKQKVCLSDLILAAVCTLQEKNGVGACEIIEYVADKRGCKVEQVEQTVRMVLCKAKLSEILIEKKDCYRINERYDDIPKSNLYYNENNKERSSKRKKKKHGSEKDEDKEFKNLCAGLKLSRTYLEDDEDDDRRCPPKRRKGR